MTIRYTYRIEADDCGSHASIYQFLFKKNRILLRDINQFEQLNYLRAKLERMDV